MPATSSTDAHGTTYTIPAEPAVRTPGAQWRPGCPAVELWWSRNGAKADDETLIIRQEYADRSTADVLELTFGQAYDLIDALNKAVESK
jgi:hypothetical protein